MKSIITVIIVLFSLAVHAEGFLEDTLVHTPEGLRLINTLKVHDAAISYDTSSLSRYDNSIMQISSTQFAKTIYIVIQDQNNQSYELIGSSPKQLFYVPLKQKWIKASKLQIHDTLATLDGKGALITDMLVDYQPNTFYRLSVRKPHTYCVTPRGVIVHNFIFTITLTWIIGEGLVMPTFAGIASGAVTMAIKYVIEKINRNQERSRYLEALDRSCGSVGINDSREKIEIDDYVRSKNNDKDKTRNPNKKERKEQNNAERVVPGSAGPIDPNDPINKDKHKNGIHHGAPYHRKDDNGRKSREPRDPQDLLDKSIEVPNNSSSTPQRIAWESDDIIAVFKQQSPGLFHGHTSTWDKLTTEAQNALKRAGLANNRGIRIKP